MKAVEQYFSVVLFVTPYEVVLTFESASLMFTFLWDCLLILTLRSKNKKTLSMTIHMSGTFLFSCVFFKKNFFFTF